MKGLMLTLLCLLIAPVTSLAQKLPAPEINYIFANAQGQHESDREYHGWCIQLHASPVRDDVGYRIRMHREAQGGKGKKVRLTEYAQRVVDGKEDKGGQFYFPDKQRGWLGMPISVYDLGNGKVHVAYICGFASNQTVAFQMAIGKDKRISQLTRKIKVILPEWPSEYKYIAERFE